MSILPPPHRIQARRLFLSCPDFHADLPQNRQGPTDDQQRILNDFWKHWSAALEHTPIQGAVPRNEYEAWTIGRRFLWALSLSSSVHAAVEEMLGYLRKWDVQPRETRYALAQLLVFQIVTFISESKE